MTVRVYIYQMGERQPCNCKWWPNSCPCDNRTGQLKHAHAMASQKYGSDGFIMGVDAFGRQSLWLEFATEEDAAIFKLTHL